MTQSSVPPSLAPPQPPPLYGSGVQVRCAGCRDVLVVASGHTEFFCPSCQLPQMLPPELIVRAHSKPLPPPSPPPLPPLPPPPPSIHHVPAHGIDPTKMQLPCANCKALLNVPHGLTRFVCPQCAVDLAVDVSKLHQFFPSRPPPEEVNEVSIYLLLSICFFFLYGYGDSGPAVSWDFATIYLFFAWNLYEAG